ncbi:hypothetical protein BOTNAR_0572g00040 [Botryotinia narcissicola]|uniref:Uncharacterized protein n=1 Tax=Botryotinia narcissicola TaxID=278944 RepID=A0A4Z1HP34_9HELO|nr:hypothetical protein BOTNAR_0572g00040 [Botryotinia narcissicola]
MIAIFFLNYPTSNFKIATFRPHLWKSTVKFLVSLTILTILDLDFILYYGIYYIASESRAFSRLKQNGKLTLPAFMLTLKPHWLLVVTVYEIGEVLADETLSYERIIGRLKGIHKAETDADIRDHLLLNIVDIDTKEEGQTHLDKNATADKIISTTFSLSPFHYTKLRSRITIRFPSPVRSRIREMIDSATRDQKFIERHKAVRMIVETEQGIEKLYSRSESSMPRMIEHLEALERKLKDIFVNAEMTAAKIEAGDKNEDESQDEEEMESGVLTPSNFSDEWTPVESPSTPSAHSEYTFEDVAEDEEENILSGSLTPSTSSRPSSPGLTLSSSSFSPPQSSPSPTATITGRPWHLFLVDTLYKCGNSLHDEWRTTELFNAWCKNNLWFAVTEGEIELLEKWKSWALDDRPVDQKWNL